MKKYRSLWCMSTTNHNILYSAFIFGTRFLNTGICLWKPQNSLARRGLGLFDFAPIPVHPPVPLGGSHPFHKASPDRRPEQGAETVQLRAWPVRIVDNLARQSLRDRPSKGALYRPSLLEVRLDRQHLLVEDTDNTDSAGVQQVVHDMLPVLVPVEPWADLVAGAAHSWALSKGLETGLQTLDKPDRLPGAPSVMGIPDNAAKFGLSRP